MIKEMIDLLLKEAKNRSPEKYTKIELDSFTWNLFNNELGLFAGADFGEILTYSGLEIVDIGPHPEIYIMIS